MNTPHPRLQDVNRPKALELPSAVQFQPPVQSKTTSNKTVVKIKDLKTNNSIKNIKKSLFDLTRNESKKFLKPDEEAKEVKANKFDQEMHSDQPETVQKSINTSIPKELPKYTKKFVEVGTDEVLYLTQDGSMYTETSNGALKKLDSLHPLLPQPPSPKAQMMTHIKNKNSLSESLSTPMLNERNNFKPEGFNV